jgi:predicted secreted protein
MTIPLGKNLLLSVENPSVPGTFQTIARLRTNTKTNTNEQIDVTNKDAMPWKQLISGGVQSIELPCQGVFSDAATVQRMLQYANGNVFANYQLADGLGNIVQCQFQITSGEFAGPYNKEQTYSFKLTSAGTPIFTNAQTNP